MNNHIRILFEMNGKQTLGEGSKIINQYYELVVPTKMSIGYIDNDYDVIKGVRKAMDSDIKRIESDKEFVRFYCNKGKKQHVNTLQDIYRLKEIYEGWIKQKMMVADIYEYTLIIRLDTIYDKKRSNINKYEMVV